MANYQNEVRVRKCYYGTHGGRSRTDRLSASANKFAKMEGIPRSEARESTSKSNKAAQEKVCYTMVCTKDEKASLRSLESFERASLDAGADYRSRKLSYDQQKALLFKEFNLEGKKWRSIDEDTRSYLLKELKPLGFVYYEIQYVLVGTNGEKVSSKTRRSTESFIFDKTWKPKPSKRTEKDTELTVPNSDSEKG